MKINDLDEILVSFLKQENYYKSMLIDGPWGCGKTTQVKNCIKTIKDKNLIYVSLFGVRRIEDISSCYLHIGKGISGAGKTLSSLSMFIPIVGNAVYSSLNNVLDSTDNIKMIKKNKIFIFDDLERVDRGMSLTSLLGFLNNLVLRGCKILCLSSLSEIKDDRRIEFDRFIEKAFDRVCYIDEEPLEIYKTIFSSFDEEIVKFISKGFNNNIRVAKRIERLYGKIDEFVKKNKSNSYDFYTNHSKEELLNATMLAIKIIYINDGNLCFSEEEKKSYSFSNFKSLSDYFGKKISEKYIREFMDKKYIYDDLKKKELYSLTKAVMHIELYDNYDFIIKECELVNVNDDSVLNETFLLLNDKGQKDFIECLCEIIEDDNKEMSAPVINKIIEVYSNSPHAFSTECNDKIISRFVNQICDGNMELYDRFRDSGYFMGTSQNEETNIIKTICDEVEKLAKQKSIQRKKDEIEKAYNVGDFKKLKELYKTISSRRFIDGLDEYIDFTKSNNYFFPGLEKCIDYDKWYFCQEVAQFCVEAKCDREFVDFLNEYKNKYPKEKSLENKIAIIKKTYFSHISDASDNER